MMMRMLLLRPLFGLNSFLVEHVANVLALYSNFYLIADLPSSEISNKSTTLLSKNVAKKQKWR